MFDLSLETGLKILVQLRLDYVYEVIFLWYFQIVQPYFYNIVIIQSKKQNKFVRFLVCIIV